MILTESPEKRALVTGGGGFVCRHIVEALLEAGWNVVALDRAFDPDLLVHWRSRWQERVKAIMGTVEELYPMSVDAVIHGAALTASPEEADLSPEEHLRANLDPTLQILEWASANHARRTLCISSAAVYARTSGKVTESLPATPDNLYAIAKSATESLVETLRRDYGRDVITIRLSNVYGTAEISRNTRPRVSLVAQLIEQALSTGTMTITAPDTLRDWTFAPDIGQAVVHLLKQSRLEHALYNIASEQHVTTKQLAEQIQAHLPETQIIISENEAPSHARQGYLGNARLMDETGFEAWTPLQDGLAQVIAWQKQHEGVH